MQRTAGDEDCGILLYSAWTQSKCCRPCHNALARRLRPTSECLLGRDQFLLLYSIDLRVAESELVQRFANGARDDEPSEPLVIGRHHVPWGKFRRRSPDHVLECMHIVVPVLALLDVG